MKPRLTNDWAVQAHCPDCGTLSLFDFKDSSHEFGTANVPAQHTFDGKQFAQVTYKLVRCSGCGRGAVAKIHTGGSPNHLESFHPRALETAALPAGVPTGIEREYREAELCASVEAWRAASAMLRSTLEKTLKANGYTTGTLQQKVDQAAADGVITAARSQRAHDDIRVLGNEVVHNEWREVKEDEVRTALHYAQRVLEDLYDDRASVEAILKAKNRIT